MCIISVMKSLRAGAVFFPNPGLEHTVIQTWWTDKWTYSLSPPDYWKMSGSGEEHQVGGPMECGVCPCSIVIWLCSSFWQDTNLFKWRFPQLWNGVRIALSFGIILRNALGSDSGNKWSISMNCFHYFSVDMGAPPLSLFVSQWLEYGLHMHAWGWRAIDRKGGQRMRTGKTGRQAFCIP